MINAEQLNAIKERVASASTGPWYYEVDGDLFANGETVLTSFVTEHGIPILKMKNADAEFIAKSREDVPALVAEIERLQQQLEKANGLLGWAHDVLDDVHCYETDVYQEISEYFGEDE